MALVLTYTLICRDEMPDNVDKSSTVFPLITVLNCTSLITSRTPRVLLEEQYLLHVSLRCFDVDDFAMALRLTPFFCSCCK